MSTQKKQKKVLTKKEVLIASLEKRIKNYLARKASLSDEYVLKDDELDNKIEDLTIQLNALKKK